jgi:L-alanine-DL-glutamate epimerase-like enolase superfamily enzyme
LKIAALAETHHLSVAPHDCTGPVNVIACLHLCAAIPNAMIMETVRGFYEGYYRDVLTDPMPIRDGRALLDQFGPGLGVSLRPEFLNRSDITRRISGK